MSAVPVARGGGHPCSGLEAAAFLMEALEIIARGAVDEEDEGQRTFGDEVESAVIGGDADVEERVGKPDLVFDGGEVALLVAGDSGGDGVERVEADVGFVGAIVEVGGVENVLGRDVVLEAQEIVAGPVFPGVGACGKKFDDGEGVLKADGIGEPEAAALDRAGKRETRIPVAEVDAFLDVDARNWVGGAEAPAVVAVVIFEAEDVCAAVGIACTEIRGLHFGSAGGVNVEARGELVVNRIADLETIEEILRFAGASTGDVKIVEIVLRDFRESGKALREDVRAGNGDVANVAGGESVALGGVLRIDLIGGGCDLDLLVNFFGVIHGEVEFVRAGLQSDGASGDEEEALFADFEFVLADGEIFKGEAASAVGFSAVDVGGGVFEF